MGQYFLVVNIDKWEYLHPHAFGDGLKLLEFGSSGSGTMCGLAILLQSSTEQGGGNLHSDSPMVGHWAGDRIVIAGDYGAPWVDPQDLSADEPERGGPNLYSLARTKFKEISQEVIAAMMDDTYLRRDLEEKKGAFGQKGLPVPYGERKTKN